LGGDGAECGGRHFPGALSEGSLPAGRVWFWLLGYTAVVTLVNLLFIHLGGYQASNYGFVCTSDYSPFAVRGRWPVYVIGLMGIMGVLLPC
jgi:hypothetical protein